MFFLMDLENVNTAGFRGCEYLEPKDTLVIFYSDTCQKVPETFLSIVAHSGCEVQGIKLQETGKNALDFYLVSHVGRLVATNKDINEIAIISKDNGFKAIKGYYDKYLGRDLHIIYAGDIYQSIYQIKGDEGRRRKENMTSSKAIKRLDDFIEECVKRSRNQEISSDEPVEMVTLDKRSRLSELLADKELSSKDLYHKILSIYGIAEGTRVYRRVKTARSLVARHKEAEAMAV